jgi:hypothetical protein
MVRTGRGAIYMALGPTFIEEARISAQSVRCFMPDLRLVLFTDHPPLERGVFDEVIPLEEVHPKVHVNKLIAMLRSPFEQTILLDTDTFVCAPFGELFELLDHFDVAMSHDRRYIDWCPKNVGVPVAFREFNQGVIVYRQSASLIRTVEESLLWVNRLADMNGWMPDDQPPLRIALYESDLRIATLTSEYNCRFHTFGQVNGEVVILHGRIPGQPFTERNLSRIAACINKKTIPRVYVAGRVYALERPSIWGKSYFRSSHIVTMFRPTLGFWRATLRHGREFLRRRGLRDASGYLFCRMRGERQPSQ